MTRELIQTADGSPSLQLRGTNITYHSRQGAVQESKHVYIESGLKLFTGQQTVLTVFEMGFGTGLNALLTLQEAVANHTPVFYKCAENDPLTLPEVALLSYPEFLGAASLQTEFEQMHACEFEKTVSIHPNFEFQKTRVFPGEPGLKDQFHIIYYDAFAPDDQPELWTLEVFELLYAQLRENGVLVTYCSKGKVRRDMESLGFRVEKLPGPPGKKEILRAVKK